MKAVVPVLALALATVVGGCSPGGTHDAPSAPADGGAPAVLAPPAVGTLTTPPSIVLVTLDTLRRDHLGCYGYFRPTTPNLDALAATALEAGGSAALAEAVRTANTVAEAFQLAHGGGIALGDRIAEKAWRTAAAVVKKRDIALQIAVFDREGALVGRTDFKASDG